MLKILHTADWHLGKRLESFNRIEEQREVMVEICDIADEQDVDIVLVAGDVFDHFNPSTASVELFYKTVRTLSKGGKRPVIVIAGNHDAPELIEAPDVLARTNGIILAGYPDTDVKPFTAPEDAFKVIRSENGFIEITLPKFDFPVRIILTPFANEQRLKTKFSLEEKEEGLRYFMESSWKDITDRYCDEKGVNVLLAHLFVMQKGKPVPEEPEEEKPVLHIGTASAIYNTNFPNQLQYVALGHLHRQHQVSDSPCPIVYSGSPISYSFSEANQDKYVVLVELKPNRRAELTNFQLTKGKRLLRERFFDIDSAKNWLKENQNALVEITMVSEDYLSTSMQRELRKTHEGIINIIPEVKGASTETGLNKSHPDTGQSVEKLFEAYFKHKHGTEPDEKIKKLFSEVLGQEGRPSD